ncbi:MAG: phosphotransferase family protein [Anaerolineae bacterium]
MQRRVSLPPCAVAPPEIRELLICLQPPSNEFTFIIDDCQAVHVNKKMRKYFIEYRLRVRDAATERSHTVAAIAKVYASDRGAYPHQVLTYLWERGFREDAPYAVPRPLAYLPEHCLLLQGKAPGAPLGNQLHHPQAGPLGARAAARWLAHLHSLSPVAGPFLQADPTANLARYHRELRAALPAQAARLGRLFTRLRDLFHGSPAEVPLVFTHGDYHAKNVFLSTSRRGELVEPSRYRLSDGRVTVIDFDTFGLGEPARDLGYFLAQNAIMAWLRHRSMRPAEAPGRAFLDEYTAQDGTLQWPRMAAYIARTFLQSLHYELCVLHTGNLELVNLWLDFAEDALDRTTQEAPWSPLVMEG